MTVYHITLGDERTTEELVARLLPFPGVLR